MSDSSVDLMRRADPEPNLQLTKEQKAAIRLRVAAEIDSEGDRGYRGAGMKPLSGGRGSMVALAVAAAVIVVLGGMAWLLRGNAPTAPADSLPEPPNRETLQAGDVWVEETPFGDATFTVIERHHSFDIVGTEVGFIDRESLLFSADAVTWEQFSPPGMEGRPRGVQVSPGGSVAVFSDGVLSTSADRQTWTNYEWSEMGPSALAAPLEEGFYVNSSNEHDLEVIYRLNRQIPEIWADEPACDYRNRVAGGVAYIELFSSEGTNCDVEAALQSSGLEVIGTEAILGSVAIATSGSSVVITVEYATAGYDVESSQTSFANSTAAQEVADALRMQLESTLWGEGAGTFRPDLDTEQLRGYPEMASFGFIAHPSGELIYAGPTPNFIGLVIWKGSLIGLAESGVWQSTDGAQWNRLGRPPEGAGRLAVHHDQLVIDQRWFSDNGTDWEMGWPEPLGTTPLLTGAAGMVLGPNPDGSAWDLTETWYSPNGTDWTKWDSPVFESGHVLAIRDLILIGTPQFSVLVEPLN